MRPPIALQTCTEALGHERAKVPLVTSTASRTKASIRPLSAKGHKHANALVLIVTASHPEASVQAASTQGHLRTRAVQRALRRPNTPRALFGRIICAAALAIQAH